MGCTQREPFVLYGHGRQEAIVNRCEEKKNLARIPEKNIYLLHCKNLWTALCNVYCVLELPHNSPIDIPECAVDL
ncbi:MAG: hypothetical protein Ct9H90mP1_1280 [Methanobacteriota archaeon]|nr:MAG: hypothetical protein Ct9H90mP1_1280 [Euryarchaeota archaeon]